MVRAKFQVYEVAKTLSGHKVVLQPVTSGSEENKEFFKWTPSGKIELYCINDKAVEQFEVGKEYYVDFTLAE